MTTLWIFKDLNAGVVRVSSVQPQMDPNTQILEVKIPNGAQLTMLSRQISGLAASDAGLTSPFNESVVKVTIGS